MFVNSQNKFGDYFINKINTIRNEIDLLPAHAADFKPVDDSVVLSQFPYLTKGAVKSLVLKSKSTTCAIDPISTSMLKQHLDILLPVITKMANSSLTSGVVPEVWKGALVTPLLKKTGLELVVKNYRPVSNLSFVSKIVERAVVNRLMDHVDSYFPSVSPLIGKITQRKQHY